MVVKLSKARVNSWRLARHHLTQRVGKGDLAKVVSDVCGIQAQVLSAAELAIRARVEEVTQQDVRDALSKDHAILRTWCMRGTIHILASSDLPLLVAALKTKLFEIQTWLQKNHAVQPEEVEAITVEIKKALEDAALAREELAHQVERQARVSEETKSYLRSAWGNVGIPEALLQAAAYQGALAFGPNRGASVTFVRPDRWTASWSEPPTAEAFKKVFWKFISCYGPVTTKDFDHWWGNLANVEKSILKEIGKKLEEVKVEEYQSWMLRPDAEEASGLDSNPVVRLLPSFDCYSAFYTPREFFIAQAHRSRIFKRTAYRWIYPTLVIDGSATGIWNMRKRTKQIEIRVEPFRKLDTREKDAVLEEAGDISRFYGSPVPAEVRYSAIT